MNKDKYDDDSDKRAKRLAQIRKLMTLDKKEIIEICINYDEELHKLENSYNQLMEEAEKLEEKLAVLEAKLKPTQIYGQYNRHDPGIAKIRFLLLKNVKLMRFRDIMKRLLEIDPHLKDQWGNVRVSISQILHRACKYGAIKRVKIYGLRGAYQYGLPEWFDQQGRCVLKVLERN